MSSTQVFDQADLDEQALWELLDSLPISELIEIQSSIPETDGPEGSATSNTDDDFPLHPPLGQEWEPSYNHTGGDSQPQPSGHNDYFPWSSVSSLSEEPTDFLFSGNIAPGQTTLPYTTPVEQYHHATGLLEENSPASPVGSHETPVSAEWPQDWGDILDLHADASNPTAGSLLESQIQANQFPFPPHASSTLPVYPPMWSQLEGLNQSPTDTFFQQSQTTLSPPEDSSMWMNFPNADASTNARYKSVTRQTDGYAERQNLGDSVEFQSGQRPVPEGAQHRPARPSDAVSLSGNSQPKTRKIREKAKSVTKRRRPTRQNPVEGTYEWKGRHRCGTCQGSDLSICRGDYSHSKMHACQNCIELGKNDCDLERESFTNHFDYKRNRGRTTQQQASKGRRSSPSRATSSQTPTEREGRAVPNTSYSVGHSRRRFYMSGAEPRCTSCQQAGRSCEGWYVKGIMNECTSCEGDRQRVEDDGPVTCTFHGKDHSSFQTEYQDAARQRESKYNEWRNERR